MRPTIYLFLSLFFLVKNVEAQKEQANDIYGTLILNNHEVIQTGKVSFIVGNSYYFSVSNSEKVDWIYSIPLDSLSSYEYEGTIRTYKFNPKKKARQRLRFFRRVSYGVTTTGVMVGILSALTPTMTTSSLITTLGFAGGITGLGVYMCIRSIKKTVAFIEYELAVPYLAKETPTSEAPGSNP